MTDAPSRGAALVARLRRGDLRLVGSVVALVGVGLAAATVVLPTWRFVLSDQGRGVVLSSQTTWSWGRMVLQGSADGPQRVIDNAPGLTVLVITLLAGLAGALACGLSRSPRAALLGIVGLVVVATRIATSSLQTLGRGSVVDGYLSTGLDVRSYNPPGAVLEAVAAVLLVVAVVLLLVAALRATSSRPAEDAGSASIASSTSSGSPAVAVDAAPDIRPSEEATPTTVAGLREPSGRPLSGDDVGFSEPDDSSRFRPPSEPRP